MSEEESVAVSKATVSRPIGLSGLVRSNGYVYEEFLPQLKGEKANKIYREMSDNDPIVGSMLFAIDMFMRKVGWTVEAASESPEDEENAEFLRECKEDMSTTWPDFISEVNTMLPFGWSWFEILYKRRENKMGKDGNAVSKYSDGRIGWRKFDTRSQESWDKWVFDEKDGSLLGLIQRPAPDYVERYIPIRKSLLFRTTSRKDNPEGRSVLRNAYRPWYFKKRIEEIEGIGVERDLAGLPFAEVPAEMMSATASDTDKAMVASIVDLVKNVRRDQTEGVVWPQTWNEQGVPQYTFKLLNSGGTRQFSTDSIITRYEQRIAMTVLADFILLGNDSTGSFALSTTKSGMFQATLGAWLDIIQDVLNNYAVPRLFRLNGMDGPFPRFVHEPVQQPSLADLATFVAALAGAGAQLFPDTDLENHFRKLALLPLRDDDSSDKERDLRDAMVEQQIEAARAGAKQAKSGLSEKIQEMQLKTAQTMGKDPNSTPGAPTKTTGPVKSKLPPQERRATAATAARNNTQVQKNRNLDFDEAEREVYDYLKQNYPERTLEWVADAKWNGTDTIPLSEIDMSRRPGGRNMEKVKGIAQAVQDGKDMEPIILVRTPGNDKLVIADGYHRTLGFQHAGKKSIEAFIGHVEDEDGPWDTEMHAAKLNKRRVIKVKRSVLKQFNPNQPRHPAGSPLGGQFLAIRGMKMSLDTGYTPDVAQRLASGEATYDDVMTGVNRDRIGDFWYRVGADDLDDSLIDSRLYASGEEGISGYIDSPYEEDDDTGIFNYKAGNVGGELGIVFVAQPPEGWDPEVDNADDMYASMMGNSYLPGDTELPLQQVQYTPDNGENWYTVDARGQTVRVAPREHFSPYGPNYNDEGEEY